MRRTHHSVNVSRRFTVAIAALAASVGWTVGNIDSADSSSSGFQVCVSKTSGAMRLASVRRCTSSERRITMGAEGPTGAQGPAGAQGPQGAQGATGATGPAGSNASVETVSWSFPYLTTSWGNCPLAFLGDGPTPVGYLISNPYSAYSSSNATPIYSCTARIKAVK
jgi:hypothetical protein